MKKIVMTGGGTAGHVTPNIALIPKLKEMGYDISYIGTYDGIEKKLIEDIGIPYYGISSGKLRRYFDLENFTDPFKVLKGLFQAKKLMKKLKPDVVFSKGGFVTVPVVLAAAARKIPVVIHESDMTPGLANKIALPRASRICCNFPETQALFSDRATVTGTPIRAELFSGDADAAFTYCKFTEKKPTILVIGGSTGAKIINETVWTILDDLLKSYNVIHICGKGNTKPELDGKSGYAQFEYVKKELADMFALADIAISRAGANAICELLALKKPNILIPLSKAASRGDQILNAKSFKKSGYSVVIEEEELTGEKLLKSVDKVIADKDKYINTMNGSDGSDSIKMITDMIDELASK
ncbi:MAG: undecaprenyldiphospho-muramoylpentapeptide beta-N-acetylglucosaminyltransferase [Eubacterium sp.]|nr:undecaprenyldiphospho-muramoylpentapeptide beta-N-acetylglucosaminyltransferase [Eubacterium sp.]